MMLKLARSAVVMERAGPCQNRDLTTILLLMGVLFCTATIFGAPPTSSAPTPPAPTPSAPGPRPTDGDTQPPPAGPGHPQVPSNAQPAWAGRWAGSIQTPGQPLRIVVRLRATPAGPTGTIDIPVQGARGLRLENITIEAPRLTFTISGVPGSPTFAGALHGDTFAGTFTQAQFQFPFTLERQAGPDEPTRRPQDPVPPLPYRVEEVRIPAGEVTLAGTLTTPPGDGPFTGVILLTGSGPQNRDQEIMDHRPFAVWADALTRAGFAVLRCDDRGVAGSTGDFAVATLREFADDAEACWRWLTARDQIDRAGLLGHSEGAIVAAHIAARNDDIAFVVMIAGPGLPGRGTLLAQNRALMRTAGLSEEQAEAVVEAAGRLFDGLEQGLPDDELLARVTALIRAQTPTAPPPDEALQELARATLRQIRTPWFRTFLAHDPADDLRRLRVPVLALFGSLDRQVVPAEERPPMEEALRAAPTADVTVRVFEGLNHLMQPARTGAIDEYATIQTTVAPEVLRAVGDWLAERFPAR
jgi:pimeloyl-ACP methyl ester carboxylesterase